MTAYEFITDVIDEAGGVLLHARDKGFDVETKGGDTKDLVTDVDRAVESFLVGELKKHFPEDSIYSEEGAQKDTPNMRQWVIDPIDGTANFSRGIPHYGVCLGLLEGGVPTAGVVYNPVTRELFSFEKGRGVFLNGKSIQVSDIHDLSRAHIFFHAGRTEAVRDWGGESYCRLLVAARKTNNMASSALDTCFVAAGRIEANVYGTLSTLDVAPALGILYEAGGVACDTSGNALEFSGEPHKVYMANSPELLVQVRELLEAK